MLNLAKQFEARFGSRDIPYACFFAPGRVNLIGEHLDYNGGLVLPMAIERGIYALVSRREDTIIRLQSTAEQGELSIDTRFEHYKKRQENWHNYPLGVMCELTKLGVVLPACDILLHSTLPIGSGLSSSAAVEMLIAYTLLSLADSPWIHDRSQLARLCQYVENHYIGVGCGIMDQMAVGLGKKDCALLLDCQTLDYEYIPCHFGGDYTLVIMNTNKPRTLIESKYNERRQSCEIALQYAQKDIPNLENLCQLSLEYVPLLPDEELRRRARHVVTEQQRVLAAVQAMQKNDWISFGQLMTASHQSLRYDYEVTGFELDTLVDLACQQPSCLGSRMTGAGFGGCAIALVQHKAVAEFSQLVSEAYMAKTGYPLAMYLSTPADGVKLLTPAAAELW